MHRVVIVLVITILALAVVGCSGSDEPETTEMTESPTVLATQQSISTLVPTELPTNTLPISTAPPTNTLPISTAQSVVNTESNLRAGPGTEYDKISIASNVDYSLPDFPWLILSGLFTGMLCVPT